MDPSGARRRHPSLRSATDTNVHSVPLITAQIKSKKKTVGQLIKENAEAPFSESVSVRYTLVVATLGCLVGLFRIQKARITTVNVHIGSSFDEQRHALRLSFFESHY